MWSLWECALWWPNLTSANWWTYDPARSSDNVTPPGHGNWSEEEYIFLVWPIWVISWTFPRWRCPLSCFSRVWLFATPWTVAHQTLLSLGFSRQDYWSGLPFPPPGDLPNPGIESTFLTSTCIGRWVLHHEHQLGSPKVQVDGGTLPFGWPWIIGSSTLCWLDQKGRGEEGGHIQRETGLIFFKKGLRTSSRSLDVALPKPLILLTYMSFPDTWFRMMMLIWVGI